VLESVLADFAEDRAVDEPPLESATKNDVATCPAVLVNNEISERVVFDQGQATWQHNSLLEHSTHFIELILSKLGAVVVPPLFEDFTDFSMKLVRVLAQYVDFLVEVRDHHWYQRAWRLVAYGRHGLVSRFRLPGRPGSWKWCHHPQSLTCKI